MKRLFIIFFLTSISLHAQVHKDSVSSIDSITKLALTKKIKLLQTKLDYIIKDEKKEEVEKPWSVKGRVNFVFNQTYFSNWLAGGENNTAGNIGVNYDFNYRNKKMKLDNKIISTYGITHANNQGFRKTDDRFEYNSIFALESIDKWYISFFSNFITQFSRGFDYSQDPRLEVSSIFSPAYFSF